MSKRFELLVFDWDGTLMDSAAAIIASIQLSCSDLGLPVPERERAAHVIGLGLKDALSYAVPELPPSDYGKLAERYRHHYLARDPDIELFPGMREMLVALKESGHVLAVATGKSRAGLERVLEATRLKQYFDSSRCADETHSKPHPAMLQELMQELTIEPAATLMKNRRPFALFAYRQNQCAVSGNLKRKRIIKSGYANTFAGPSKIAVVPTSSGVLER